MDPNDRLLRADRVQGRGRIVFLLPSLYLSRLECGTFSGVSYDPEGPEISLLRNQVPKAMIIIVFEP